MRLLRSHFLANPCIDLRHLDLEMFRFDAASRQFVDTFDRDTMLNAFNSPCSTLASGVHNFHLLYF